MVDFQNTDISLSNTTQRWDQHSVFKKRNKGFLFLLFFKYILSAVPKTTSRKKVPALFGRAYIGKEVNSTLLWI